MKRKLYITDLDGTLLNSEACLSKTTCTILNRLIEKGLPLTYATARSLNTASQVTQGVHFQLPVIVHNGVFIKDPQSGKILIMNSFSDDIRMMIMDFISQDLYPIVYSVIDGKEAFSFIERYASQAQRDFLATRRNDPRYHPVSTIEELLAGDIYYVTLIDDCGCLNALKMKYDEDYRCLLSQDVYTPEWWLEIMPKGISKAHAIEQLKELMGYDYIVVFGDGVNDLELFDVADEKYAVANADDRLKERATDIIGDHDEDGVARYLEALYE